MAEQRDTRVDSKIDYRNRPGMVLLLSVVLFDVL